jgi:hypothetical protein
MGYELPRYMRECQPVNMKITKIRTSWDMNYHDGSWDENEPVRSSPASRDRMGISRKGVKEVSGAARVEVGVHLLAC